MKIQRDRRGMALSMVFLFTAMCSLLVGYSLRAGFEQTSFTFKVGANRATNYVRAQSGIVDAQWRIRNNNTVGIGGGDFTNPNFNPAPYFIDIDADAYHITRTAADDARIDIGPVDPVTFVRPINSTGLDPQ